MPYVTSIERYAIEKGKQEGLEEGREEGRQEGRQEARKSLRQAIISALLVRWERVPDGVSEALEAVTELDTLTALLDAAIRAGSLEEFQQRLPTPGTETRSEAR